MQAIDDPTGPLGIRLASQREGERLRIDARAPTVLVPVHAGLAEITVGATKQLVDSATWMLVPAGTRVSIRAKSPVTHTLVLTITHGLRETVVRTYEGEIERALFERYLGARQVMPRTVWVNEICHRYLFERAVCKKSDNVATHFLESEIVKEVYFVCHTAAERASHLARPPEVVERAMKIVEENLFEPDVVKIIARRCAASPSTLLRAFKKELGVGPADYVRKRRLDESMLLLKARRYRIGEVATLVGYRNLAAFSQAFRARFGLRPSDVR